MSGLFVLRSAFPPRLTIRGDRCVVKSVGGSSQVLEIRRAILQSRQKIDLRGDCEWTTTSAHSGRVRPTNLVSERLCGRRLSVEDAGLVDCVGKRTQRLASADWELQIGLDGRSVPDQRNERIDAPGVVGAVG